MSTLSKKKTLYIKKQKENKQKDRHPVVVAPASDPSLSQHSAGRDRHFKANLGCKATSRPAELLYLS